MLQWFLRFSEFTEFNESSAPFRENSNVFILDAQNFKPGKYLSTSPIRTVCSVIRDFIFHHWNNFFTQHLCWKKVTYKISLKWIKIGLTTKLDESPYGSLIRDFQSLTCRRSDSFLIYKT